MAHGGYGRKNTGRAPLGGRGGRGGRGRGGGRSSVGGVRKENDKKKSKPVSTKNQIRSIERLLKKELPAEVKEAQQKRLEELKLKSDAHVRAELERKMALRYRRVKFFERRKIERRIRRLEKQQRALLENLSEDHTTQLETVAEELHQLKEDLEYIRFFPKTEKYISLFMGKDDPEVSSKRDQLRERIKANLLAAAAAGHDLEETGSDEEGMDMSEDDFFMAGSSGDDADADDEWTDRAGEEKDEAPQELVLPAPEPPVVAETDLQRRPGKAAKPNKPSAKDQNQKFARAMMPPPPSSSKSPVPFTKSTYNVDNKNRNNNNATGYKSKTSRASTGSDSAANNNNSIGYKSKTSWASTGSDSAANNNNNNTFKNKNIWPSSVPNPASKRPRFQGASSGTTGDRGRPAAAAARSGQPSGSSTSYENTKSSVSDGPAVQPTKPKRKRRPKKKKA